MKKLFISLKKILDTFKIKFIFSNNLEKFIKKKLANFKNEIITMKFYSNQENNALQPSHLNRTLIFYFLPNVIYISKGT